MSEIEFRFAHVDQSLLTELQMIVRDTGITADPHKEIKNLARAVLEVAAHCASVEKALHLMAEKAVLKPR
jgi:hypothetical protein